MSEYTLSGRCVFPDGVRNALVRIDADTGLILDVTDSCEKGDLHYGCECLVFSGFIDIHVHAREDTTGENNHKEDFATASAAASAGGVTYFLDMPNNPAPPIDEESYNAKMQCASLSDVEVLLYAGVGVETTPINKSIPYKAFIGPSTGALGFPNEDLLQETMKRYSGCCVAVHAECPDELEKYKNENTHEKKRPDVSEIKAIEMALRMLKKSDIELLNVCHVSTKGGVELIKEAKENGESVIAEATPHHLYFNSDDGVSSYMQVNPPIRSSENSSSVLNALREGVIDVLATDHAPHTIAEKNEGCSGVPNLDTYGAFATWLLSKGFSPIRVAEVASATPGKYTKRFDGKTRGVIKKGAVASFTVLEPSHPTTVCNKDIKSKCKWTPFDGVTFPGRVYATIIKGRVAFKAND